MSALADYYAAQANEFNAKLPLLSAQREQVQQQSAQIAPDAAAKRALDLSQAGLVSAQAGQIAPDAEARRADVLANTNLARVQAGALTAKLPFDLATLGADAAKTNALTGTIGPEANARIAGQTLQNQQLRYQIYGFAKGGVVGKDKAKPAKSDTVPAMLAPGEAVLNAHAVQHYGEDVISHMNKMGLMRKKAHGELTKMIGRMSKAGDRKSARKKA